MFWTKPYREELKLRPKQQFKWSKGIKRETIQASHQPLKMFQVNYYRMIFTSLATSSTRNNLQLEKDQVKTKKENEYLERQLKEWVHFENQPSSLPPSLAMLQTPIKEATQEHEPHIIEQVGTSKEPIPIACKCTYMLAEDYCQKSPNTIFLIQESMLKRCSYMNGKGINL